MKLGQCPFCKCHMAKLITGPKTFDRVQCGFCGATGPWFDGHPEDAVRDWNSASQQSDSKVCPNCGKDKATDIHCNHKFHE